MAWPFSGVAAPNFDSGFVTIGMAPSAVPGGPGIGVQAWLLGMFFTNSTDSPSSVTFTDQNGVQIMPDVEVPAHGVLAVGMEFMPVLGVLNWQASQPVVGKMWGYI